MSEKIVIDVQSPYKWKPEYLPLYRGLVKKKNSGELTSKEKQIVEWLSYSLINYTTHRSNARANEI